MNDRRKATSKSDDGVTQVIIDNLYHLDEEHLPLDEAIHRITSSFRRVTLDRFRGDLAVRHRHDQLITIHSPQDVLEEILSHLGSTVWLAISDEAGPEGSVEFLLSPNQNLFVKYDSESERERLRPTVQKLADLLGYEIGIWETFLNVSIEHDHSLSVVGDLQIQRVLFESIEDQGIGNIEECRVVENIICFTVKVTDEQFAREKIASVVSSEFPDMPFTMEVPPNEWPWLT